jgi:hypothetical protein
MVIAGPYRVLAWLEWSAKAGPEHTVVDRTSDLQQQSAPGRDHRRGGPRFQVKWGMISETKSSSDSMSFL